MIESNTFTDMTIHDWMSVICNLSDTMPQPSNQFIEVTKINMKVLFDQIDKNENYKTRI